MQIKGTTFYGRRTLYYWAKIFGSQLDYQEAVDVAVKEVMDSAVKETEMNTAIEIAKRLLGSSLSENEIAKITGLSVEQIAHIKHELS